MSAVDRAAVRVLKGEIGLEKVGRHRVTKGAVKSRLTRLKNGVQKMGRKPALAMEIEQQLATYIDDHTAAGMCRSSSYATLSLVPFVACVPFVRPFRSFLLRPYRIRGVWVTTWYDDE